MTSLSNGRPTDDYDVTLPGTTPARRKVVIVGDGYCGKTSLLLKFTRNEFANDYIPTVCEATTAEIEIDGLKESFILWDTAGQEDYDRLRPLCYPRTNVFVLCFSVSDRGSLASVRKRWIPELEHFCPGVPVLLVATKIDLRDSDDVVRLRVRSGPVALVSPEEGSREASDAKAALYVECSALSGQGVGLVFDVAARLAIKHQQQQQQRQGAKFKLQCVVL